MLRPSPHHGTLRVPNDDDGDIIVCNIIILCYLLCRALRNIIINILL